MRDEFSKYSKPKAADSSSVAVRSFLSFAIHFTYGLLIYFQNDSEFKDFADIPMDDMKEVDELDEYLSSPIERVRNLIVWWWEHRQTYPQLSAMAFDFLSAPGTCDSVNLFNILLTITLATSTAVERVFSQGCQLLSYTRNRMSPSTIRSILCFGNWSRKDLVYMPELVEALDSRKRKHALVEEPSVEI